jgi:Helix-turn-helix domain/RodZ C-terminal domain
MDKSVGQVLQEARTRRGLDLNEAERVTKIRVKFLRAMEEDRWGALPAPVYARSFLATYARFLGLDVEPLVEQYERTAPEAGRAESIPAGTIRAGGIRSRHRPLKPILLAVAGLMVLILVGLVIVGSLGGSGGGGAGNAKSKRATKQEPSKTPATTPTTPASASEVSLELRSTAAVWVCLVDSDDRALLAETVPPGEKRGPFEARAFDVTFGNGSVEMTVNGEPTSVPPLAEPLGYRITTAGVRRLDPSAGPTCT